MLLVHGGPGLPGYMRSLGDMLKGRHSVSEYYQRDSALSDAGGPFTIDSYVSDLAAVVSRLRQRRPVVIAHSFGSTIAVEYAKRHSSRIERLILLNPILEGQTWKRFVGRLKKRLRAGDPKIGEKLARAQDELSRCGDAQTRFRAFHRLFDLYWPAYFASGRRPLGLAFKKVDVQAVAKIEKDFLAHLRAGRFTKDLAKIKVPIDHIHGEVDPLPWRIAARILRAKADAYSLRIIRRAGHFPWLDSPARRPFLETLERCIGGRKSESFRRR